MNIARQWDRVVVVWALAASWGGALPCWVFFFQAEDGIRDLVRSRGLGDVYKRQDGYIEAALELASAVLDKKLVASRDTLAMPILYNGRHALELSLKFAINRLHLSLIHISEPTRPY